MSVSKDQLQEKIQTTRMKAETSKELVSNLQTLISGFEEKVASLSKAENPD
jgi:hypothetical protein